MFSLKNSYFLNEKVANFPQGSDVRQTRWWLPLRLLCCAMSDKIIICVRQLEAAQLQPAPRAMRAMWLQVACSDLYFWLKHSVSDLVKGYKQSHLVL